MEVSVVIGTYGHKQWIATAQRAIRSVPEGIPVIHKHEATLAQARNAGLAEVETKWMVHLDADDELSPDYFEQLAKGSADIRAPSVERMDGSRPSGQTYMPQVYGHWEHQCVAECLRYGNWIVIGALCPTEMVREIGWEEFGWSEDWGMWARCYRAGATFEALPEAVYRVHHQRRSRNQISVTKRLHWHRVIEAAVWPDEESVL